MNQLHYNQPALTTEPTVETMEVVTPIPSIQFDPTILLPYGGVTVAVILSIAFLILVLAEYNKVFMAAILDRCNDKTR
jgi:hypothetical protein